MCGIVGMIGDLDARHKDLMRDMLDVCQLRGRHSTGVVKITKTLDYTWVKQVGPPSYLFDTKRYDQMMQGTASGYIGHCRHKTFGDVSIANAHPFDMEDDGICGVHNGTLTNFYRLPGHIAGQIDSETLYATLAKVGPQETFSELEGAWACVWWNDQNSTMNFIRNNQRPLWFCWSKDKRVMFWASEKWMFGALERDDSTGKGIDLFEGDEEHKVPKFVELPVNTLWSFSLHPTAKLKEPFFRLKTPLLIEQKKKEVRGYQGNLSGSSGGSSGKPWNVGQQNGGPPMGWRDNGKGVFLRDQGGEVPRPFVQPELLLDDPLPESLSSPTTEDTPGAKTNTNSDTKSSNKDSQTSSGSTTPSNSSKTTQTKESPTSEPSSSSQKTNRKKLSVVLKEPCGTTASNNPTVRRGVSTRTVAGIGYITNNVTGKEYSEMEFGENTKGLCCHCLEPIGALEEVYEIYDDESFLCKPCVLRPEDQLKLVVNNATITPRKRA